MTKSTGGHEDELTDSFREAMSKVTQPVTVVAAVTGSHPWGLTVGTFASVSLRPAMVSIAIGNQSRALEAIMQSRRFGVSVLAATEATVARRFSTSVPHRFDGVGWHMRAGAPCLEAAAVWFACALENNWVIGDHTLIVGRVDAVSHTNDQTLSYCGRDFGQHAAVPS